MSRRDMLPSLIPVFPLPGALLLPRARLPLNIFEPRYLAMVEDCLATRHRLIGVIQPQEGSAAEPPSLLPVGCAGRLSGFAETDDGRYMITLTGVSRFRLRAEVAGDTPYRLAEVDWAPFAHDIGPPAAAAGFDRPAFLDLLRRFLVQRGLDTDWGKLGEAEDERLIDTLAILLPLAPADRQALLEAPDLTARAGVLAALLEFALHGGAGAGGRRQ